MAVVATAVYTGLARLENLYDRLERSMPLDQAGQSIASLTRFRSNRGCAVHRWFPFKEGFSSKLLGACGDWVGDAARRGGAFLDPFCGSGTTVLSADLDFQWRGDRLGVEINPFLHFVASTKTHWRRFSADRLAALTPKVLAPTLREDLDPDSWPALTTLRRTDMFEPARVSALLDAVKRAKAVQEPERDLLLLGIAASIERLGFYRKDGRALRILREPTELAERRSASVETLLKSAWDTYEADLRLLAAAPRSGAGRGRVLLGDGRSLDVVNTSGVEAGAVDVVAFSPPYLNHIDYTEVYKVEAWLLGFLSSQEEMLAQRKRTLRSHASVGIDPWVGSMGTQIDEIVNLTASMIEITGGRWHRAYRRLVSAYLADMQVSLTSQYALISPGGHAVCVVGNSAHGSGHDRVPIAVDLLIADIARRVGFELEKVLVVRQLMRRDYLNRYLRESLIILRKPKTAF